MALRKLLDGWYEVEVCWTPGRAPVPFAVHLSQIHGVSQQAPGLTWLYTPRRILEVAAPYGEVLQALGLVPQEEPV